MVLVPFWMSMKDLKELVSVFHSMKYLWKWEWPLRTVRAFHYCRNLQYSYSIFQNPVIIMRTILESASKTFCSLLKWRLPTNLVISRIWALKMWHLFQLDKNSSKNRYCRRRNVFGWIHTINSAGRKCPHCWSLIAWVGSGWRGRRNRSEKCHLALLTMK